MKQPTRQSRKQVLNSAALSYLNPVGTMTLSNPIPSPSKSALNVFPIKTFISSAEPSTSNFQDCSLKVIPSRINHQIRPIFTKPSAHPLYHPYYPKLTRNSNPFLEDRDHESTQERLHGKKQTAAIKTNPSEIDNIVLDGNVCNKKVS